MSSEQEYGDAAVSSEDLIDQQDLVNTQDIRRKVISTVMKGGQIPADVEDRRYLFMALDGIDKQILTRRKVKAEERASQTKTATANLIADILLQTQNRSKQIPAEPAKTNLDENYHTQTVPGQLDVGTINIAIDQIIDD